MSKTFSRRDFLKLGALSLGALAFNEFPFPQSEYGYLSGDVGRITASDSISVFKEPNDQSQILGQRYQDELVNIYYEVAPPTGPAWNPRWYRVWGGFIHSKYVQRVKINLNQPAGTILNDHQLGEVTVPFTQIYRYSRAYGWEPKNKLYYETVHWITGVEQGPDGEAWYRIYDELLEVEYHAPASHIRMISDEEIAPISPEVPPHEKWVEVLLQTQTVKAYENEKLVFETKVSTGSIGGKIPPEGFATPYGGWRVYSKMPSKHMGDSILTGAPDVYTLPGVPWTSFFHTTGVAFHGTYWHDNFGVPMSRGCVNMRSPEAKWLFRWLTPDWPPPEGDPLFWERRGSGTLVIVK